MTFEQVSVVFSCLSCVSYSVSMCLSLCVYLGQMKGERERERKDTKGIYSQEADVSRTEKKEKSHIKGNSKTNTHK